MPLTLFKLVGLSDDINIVQFFPFTEWNKVLSEAVSPCISQSPLPEPSMP